MGDVDGDGRLDIVTRDIRHGVFILLQDTPDVDGGVRWRERRFVPTRAREGLDLFDPDSDGDLDVILNGIWLETPDDLASGTFIEHVYAAAWYPSGTSTAEVRDYAVQLAVRDFNGDGRDDIAISNSEELNNAASTDGKPKGIRVYLAPIDPKMQDWTEVIVEGEHFSWHSLEPADLDCDGDIDLFSAISTVGADNAGKELVYFLNDGSGLNWSKTVFSTAAFVYNATLADADGDGDADLFAPDSFNAGPMRYFEHVGGSTVPDTEAPTVPAGLIGNALSFERVSLTWDAADDNVAVSSYRIFQDSMVIGSSKLTEFLVDGLAAEAVYVFSVSARDVAGNESAMSDSVTVRTQRAPELPPLDRDLIAYWPFDENGGVSATDAVSSRVASLSDAAWMPGRYGSALDLGNAADRAEVVGFDLPAGGFSMACWVFPRSFGGNGNEARFISKATSTSGSDHFWMMGNFEDGSALRFRLKLGSTTHTLISPEGVLPLNVWTHVAATFDGGTMRLFANGREVATLAQPGTVAASPSTAIGLGNQPSGAGDRALDGLLDEVRLYSRALTAEELASITVLTPFDQWRYRFFQTSDDQDGVPLFLEYAFDLDPAEFSRVPIDFVDGSFAVPMPRSELTYTPEYSGDLISWVKEEINGDRCFIRVRVSR